MRERFGTPCYVYDRAKLEATARRALAFAAPYGFTLRYAMKANPSRGILGLAAWLGLFGAFFVRAVRAARRAREPRDRALVTGAIAAIAGFLVAGLFEYNFGDTEVLLVALFMMSIVFVIEREAPTA